MAITAGMEITTTQDAVTLAGLHCVVTSYSERFKGNLNIVVSAWQSKDQYLQGLPAIAIRTFNTVASELTVTSDVRASLYTWLMQQPEFISPVADMSNDFPVTPIE